MSITGYPFTAPIRYLCMQHGNHTGEIRNLHEVMELRYHWDHEVSMEYLVIGVLAWTDTGSLGRIELKW